ncbi:Outer membrane porin signal peptide protein (fragment) [Cupriavidus taiwanensis]|uniref:porin n=1 Tax=Cupriavidus taiwanensis TaxID=164546 RepID=UPI000E11B0EB
MRDRRERQHWFDSNADAIAAAYDPYNPTQIATTGATGTIKKAGVAASYAIGDVKLMGGYRWGQTRDATGQTTMRDDYYWVGTNYQVLPALSLTLAYYYDDVKLANGTNPKNPWQLAFVADYSFSKRTDIYLTTAYSKHSPLNFDSASINYTNGYYLGTRKDSMFGAAVGIRHRF